MGDEMLRLAARSKVVDVANAIKGGAGRFNEIKATVETSSKTLSNLLKDLKRNGIISAKAVRQPGVTENRFNRYELTDKGQAWLEAVVKLADI